MDRALRDAARRRQGRRDEALDVEASSSAGIGPRFPDGIEEGRRAAGEGLGAREIRLEAADVAQVEVPVELAFARSARV